MQNFFLAISLFMGLLILVSLYRGVFGPTVFDRILGVGFVGSKSLSVLLLIGMLYNRIDMFVDIALAYSLLLFISTLVCAKYLKKKGVF